MAHSALANSALLLLCLLAGCYCVPLSWEELPITGATRNRWLAGAAFLSGRLYIFGGESNLLGSNDTGVLGELISKEFYTAAAFCGLLHVI